MTDIQYESNKPIPDKGYRRKYDFRKLQPGDSITTPATSETKFKVMASLYTAASQWAKRIGKNWTFTARSTDHKVTLWRVT